MSVQLCTNGCLLCTSDETCQICDTSNFYYYDSTAKKCVIKLAENCAILTQSGECLICKNDYYLSADGVCTELTVSEKITNCIQYDTSKKCTACDKKFYLSNNTCKTVTKEVLNCDFYKSATECSVCQNEFIFSENGKTCIAEPQKGICQNYAYTKCLQCNEKYAKNSTLYFETIFNTQTYASIIRNIKQMANSSIKFFDVCEAVQNDNCVQLDEKGYCIKCREGYYLLKNVCKKYNSPAILNCEKYSDKEICSKCKENYFLKSHRECALVDIINNCAKYDPSQYYTQCIECLSGYYLANGNFCLQRELSKNITNCETLDPQLDVCQVCKENYILSQNGLICLIRIDNCLQHQPFYELEDQLICLTCDQGYYKNTVYDSNNAASKQCIKGTVANCDIFSEFEDFCVFCKNGFYLSDKLCKAVVAVDKCEKYSNTAVNLCLQCENGHQSFVQRKVCLARTNKIANCQIYNEENNECVQCAEGYVVFNDGSKCINTLPTNCTKIDGEGNCIGCKEGYVYITHKHACAEPLDLFSSITNAVSNCEEVSEHKFEFQLLQVPYCKKCKYNYMPSYPTNTMCITVSDFQSPYYFSAETYAANNHCIQYMILLNYCVRCDDGYYVKFYSDGLKSECVAKGTGDALCGAKFADDSKESDNDYQYYLVLDNLDGKKNACLIFNNTEVEGKLQFCLVLGRIKISSYGLSDYYCLKVTSAKIDGVDISYIKYTDYYTDRLMLSSPTQLYPQYSYTSTHFVLPIDAIVNDNDGTLSQDCELKTKYGTLTPQNACLRCPLGKILKTVTNNTVQTCEDDTNCITDIVYKGYPSQVGVFMSCHVCKKINNQQLYPVTHIDTSDTVFNQYSTIAGQDNKTVCMVIPTQQDIPMVENCSNYFGFQDNNAHKYYCMACKPGYKVTTNTVSINAKNITIVSKCTIIENCLHQKQSLVNQCQKCITKYTRNQRLYYAFSDEKQNECKRVKSDNCYIAGDDLTCNLCNAGYITNKDGICEMMKPANCDASTVNIAFNYSLLYSVGQNAEQAIRYYYLRSQSKDEECKTCSTGFVNVAVSQFQFDICLQNQFVKYENFYDTQIGSQFISNCAQYQAVGHYGGYICSVCSPGYAISQDNKQCLQIDNCLIAKKEALLCLQCIDSFINMNGLCVKPDIAFCKNYVINDNVILCQKCIDEYALSANQRICLKGEVQNCVNYISGDSKICSMCKEGYGLINLEQVSYCVELPSEMNCGRVDESMNEGINYGYLDCIKCKSSDYVLSSYFYDNYDLSKKRSYCLQSPLIENCKTYIQKESFNNVLVFQCKECEKDYFLISTTKCLPYTKVTNCEIYSENIDQCLSCSSGFYMNFTTNQCESYPTGLYKCSKYTEDGKCSECLPPFYIKESVCVPSKTEIKKCVVYSGEGKCLKCDSGYLISNGSECLQMLAQNCETAFSVKACKSCSKYIKNMRLVISNGVTSCQVIDHDQNCITYGDQYPYKCSICVQNYYPDTTGTCVPVSDKQKIENCYYYQSSNTCLQCNEKYILNENSTQCITSTSLQTYSNCKLQQQLQTPICTSCAYGYFMKDENCTPCMKFGPNSGCFTCNIDDTKCLLCKPNYYMTKDGECKTNIASVKVQEQKPNYISSSQSIIQILVSLLALLAWNM